MRLSPASVLRLDDCLNKFNFPKSIRQRVKVLSDSAHITTQEASQVLILHTMPNEICLKKIAKYLEFESSWLLK